jgi:hypothetical protein
MLHRQNSSDSACSLVFEHVYEGPNLHLKFTLEKYPCCIIHPQESEISAGRMKLNSEGVACNEFQSDVSSSAANLTAVNCVPDVGYNRE